jgi:hypothetical protein
MIRLVEVIFIIDLVGYLHHFKLSFRDGLRSEVGTHLMRDQHLVLTDNI